MELHGGYGAMLEVGIEKYMRDALINLHSDGTTDVSNFKIVRAMFPDTAGTYAEKALVHGCGAAPDSRRDAPASVLRRRGRF
jgi:hypothetical protein